MNGQVRFDAPGPHARTPDTRCLAAARSLRWATMPFMPDLMLRAVAPAADLRIIVVKNDDVVQAIAEAHACTGAAVVPLGQVVTGAQLLGTQLKGPGAVSVRLEGRGALRSIIAEANPFGLVRALVRAPAEARAAGTADGLLGPGTLSVERRAAEGAPAYTGVVEVQGGDVGAGFAHYLRQSEQIDCLLGLATVRGQGSRVASGGFMVQLFPGSDAQALERLRANLARHASLDALVGACDAAELLGALTEGLASTVLRTDSPAMYCPCSRERFLSSVAALPLDDVLELLSGGKDLETRCDFCLSLYVLGVAELEAMLRQRSAGGPTN